MSMKWIQRMATTTAVLAGVLLGAPALAHCDSEDGPVITEARVAIQRGEVTPLLKWITPEQEPEIRALFDKTQAVRAQGDAAREVADQLFIETLVRLHRESEGAPYTGIKPAGTPVSPAVAHADAALERGSVDELADHLAEAVRTRVKERFKAAAEARAHQADSVDAGRTFVHRYVQFVHYVEHLHAAITADIGHHGQPAAAHAGAHEH